jgi:hypothetical protein
MEITPKCPGYRTQCHDKLTRCIALSLGYSSGILTRKQQCTIWGGGRGLLKLRSSEFLWRVHSNGTSDVWSPKTNTTLQLCLPNNNKTQSVCCISENTALWRKNKTRRASQNRVHVASRGDVERPRCCKGNFVTWIATIVVATLLTKDSRFDSKQAVVHWGQSTLLCPHRQPWRWRQCVPLKRWNTARI